MVRQLPRALHPGAWWAWALGLATVASRSRNPLLLLLVVAVAAYVVAARRSSAPWARAFVVFLKLGLVVITIRTLAHILFAPPLPGPTLFTLPELQVPQWAAGISVGGRVTSTAVVTATTEGLRLATVLACIGAANALANPKRLLASLPAALYEVGVTLTVALSFAPSLVTSITRIRAARRLRGRPDRGIRGVGTIAMPVLEDALDRSLALAAAMDSRGYGRRAPVSPACRRATAGATLGGLFGVALGMYGLLDAAAPTVLGLPTLPLGLGLASFGLRMAGHRAIRTRYRPDPWRGPEWLTLTCGVLAAAGAIIVGMVDPGAMAPVLLSITDLSLPPLAASPVLFALLPAVATPPLPTLPATGRPSKAPRPSADEALPETFQHDSRRRAAHPVARSGSEVAP